MSFAKPTWLVQRRSPLPPVKIAVIEVDKVKDTAWLQILGFEGSPFPLSLGSTRKLLEGATQL